MDALKRFIKSYPVLTYFTLTFVISWGSLLAIADSGGASHATWQDDPQLPLMFVGMLAGPSLAGLLLTAFVYGQSGFDSLFARLMKWRVSTRWYVVALAFTPVVFAAVGFAFSFVNPVFLPTMAGWSAASLAGAIAGAVVVSICEELGWTGFAIPTLRTRHGIFATGLIVGVTWGAWHLLTNDFWMADTYAGDMSFASFATLNGIALLVGSLAAYRVLMVWVYDRTDSLLVAILMHTSLTACTFILSPSTVTGLPFLLYGLASAAVWWTIVGIVTAATHVHHSEQGRPKLAAQARTA